MTRFSILAAILLVTACGDRAPDAGPPTDSASGLEGSTVAAGDTFDLNIGARVEAGEGLVVAFTSVLEDSRCPEGAQCIQAGRARLTLRVSDPSGLSREVELVTTPGETTRDTAFGRTIRLLSLSPVPTSGVPVVQGDYSARLVVMRGTP